MAQTPQSQVTVEQQPYSTTMLDMDKKDLDHKGSSIEGSGSARVYEASPAEIEDAVFGDQNEKGPNYRNVSILSAVGL